MEKEAIDVLVGNTDNQGKDFYNLLIQAQKENNVGISTILEELDKEDYEGMSRVDALAKYMAMDRLTTFHTVVEDAKFEAVKDAIDEPWWRKLPNEFSSIDELFANLADSENVSESEKSDFMYIYKTILPVAHDIGIPAATLFSARLNKSKLRIAVPSLRKNLDDKEKIEKIINTVADNDVSVRQLRKEFGSITGVYKYDPLEIHSDIYYTTKNDAMIVIYVSNRREMSAVLNRLRDLVKFNNSDYKFFVERIKRIFRLKGDSNGYNNNHEEME